MGKGVRGVVLTPEFIGHDDGGWLGLYGVAVARGLLRLLIRILIYTRYVNRLGDTCLRYDVVGFLKNVELNLDRLFIRLILLFPRETLTHTHKTRTPIE